jgi:Kef-type K+ transport system membrane component KefB
VPEVLQGPLEAVRLALAPVLALMPAKDPVLIFALVMMLLLVAPLVMIRLRIPTVIGLIAAGALVGPNAIGLLERDQTIVLLGTVGIIYLMFTAGLEIDLVEFNKAKHRSAVFGVLSFSIPQGLGLLVGFALGYGTLATILLASMFGSHTLLAYPIASRLRITQNSIVVMGVGGSIITDLSALLVLAVVAGATGGEITMAFWVRLAVGLAIFVAIVLLLLPRIGRRFFARERAEGTSDFIFVMAALFTCAYLAKVAGVEPIIGAFLAGLALNRLIPSSGTLANRIRFVGSALFVPFFLISVGMLVDLSVLASSLRVWIVALAMTGAVLVCKPLAAKISQWIFGYSAAEGWVLAGLTVPQAAATLAATLVGFDIGLFDEATVNGVIVMILVTCVVGPITVEHFGAKVALQEQHKPHGTKEAPRRILLPIVEGGATEQLVELGILLRDADAHEPLFPMTVVKEDGDDVPARVARAEKTLGAVVEQASSAEVDCVPLTRVAHSLATALVRAIKEQRISDVVAGWDGVTTGSRAVFGRMLDPILNQPSVQLLVARLTQPFSNTKRMVVLLPPLMDRNPGFLNAVRTVKGIGSRLGALVTVACTERDAERVRRVFEEEKPAVTLSFVFFEDLNEMLRGLGERLDDKDLVVLLSARRGTVAFQEQLTRLPRGLARLFPGNLLLLYPPEIEASLVDDVGRGAIDLSQIHVVVEAAGAAELAARAVHLAFPGGATHATAALEEALKDGTLCITEVLPGLSLLQGQLEGLSREVSFLGASQGGIAIPAGDIERTFVLVGVLSPPAVPMAEHLRRASEVEERFMRLKEVDGLLGASSADQVRRLLTA